MGSQQLFCLRWSNHQTNMLSVFDQLLQSEALVDVTLACEGLSFRAHKVVLSACSPYFQSLFMENPCKHPIVILKDIKYSDLRALVDFMYKGEVNVTQEQLSALLKTAETLKVKGLAEMTSSNNNSNNNMNSGSSNNSSVTGDMSSSPSSSLLATMPLSNAHASHHVRQQRTGSPLAKRKKMRHHASTGATSSVSATAMTSSSYCSRPASSSREASIDGDDDHSLEIQGSPEVIETKVEVPSDGFVPERAADQDSQMLDHEFRTSNEINAESVETKSSLAFHNATTTGSTSAATSALNKTSVGSGGGNVGNPSSAPSSPPLACSLTPATPASCSSSTLPPSLPSTSGTQPATGQAQSRSAPDSQDDDSLDTPPPLQANSSSLIEAIGAQMFGRYAPLTILPINQSMGSTLMRHEPASPSSNSSGTNPKRGQPRILNEDEENMIVRYIMDMAALGKPVTRKCVLEYGNMLLRRQDRVPTGSIHCNPEKGLSNDWWKEFKKRHPGLPFRLPVTPNS